MLGSGRVLGLDPGIHARFPRHLCFKQSSAVHSGKLIVSLGSLVFRFFIISPCALVERCSLVITSYQVNNRLFSE